MTDSPPHQVRQALPHRLSTFGTLALASPSDEIVLGGHGHHRRRLALLAVLAASGHRGRSRDQLLALFWPEATQARARHSLDQLLYALRGSVGESAFIGVNPVRLNPAVVWSDVAAFNDALERRDPEGAIAEYRGPFLDGFHLSDAPDFERWVDDERARLAAAHAAALEGLATRATAGGDHAAAVRLWRQLVEVDRVSSRNATGLMRALASSGDSVAALQHAQRHEAVVAQELGLSVDPSVATLARELRAKASARRESDVARVDNAIGAGGMYVVGAPGIDDRNESSLALAHAHDSRVPASATDTRDRVHTNRSRGSSRWTRPVAIGVIAVIALASLIRQAASGGSATPSPALSSAAGIRLPAPARASGEERIRRSTTNIAAYELYLRGRDPVHWRSDSGPLEGLALLKQAVALDSNFAAAWATIPSMYFTLVNRAPDLATAREYRRQSDAAARRALALDSLLPEAHAGLGIARMTGDPDLLAAEYAFRRALDLGGAPRVRELLSKVLLWSGRTKEALAEALQAEQEDPLSPSATADVAQALCLNGRYDEGLARLARVSSLRPPLQRAALYSGLCNGMQGNWTAALAAVNTARDPHAQALLGQLLVSSGDLAAARTLRKEWVERWQRDGHGAFKIAVVTAALGDVAEASTWFDRTADDAWGPSFVMIYPLFTGLKSNPGYLRLQQRLNTPRR